MRRTQLFWGVVLLFIGGLMLANEMGVKLFGGRSLMEFFWPIVLIFGGIWVLVGVIFRGNVKAENASIDLQGAASVKLKVDHGAGELKLHSGANMNEAVHGSFFGGLDQKVHRSGDRLDVHLSSRSDFLDFPFLGSGDRIDWDVALNADIPTSLKLSLGANKSNLDLRDMNITDLALDIGASDTKLILPARGRFRADFELGAASLEITVPEDLSARIQASLGAANINVDETRFPRNGKYYQSPGYDTAANAVDMAIEAGAAAIRVA